MRAESIKENTLRLLARHVVNLRKFFFLFLVLSLTCKASSFGPPDATRANETGAAQRSTVTGTRLRALSVTGGLWHKYKKLAPYLTKSSRFGRTANSKPFLA